MDSLENADQTNLESLPWHILIEHIGLQRVNKVLDTRIGGIFKELQGLISLPISDLTLVVRIKENEEEWKPARDQFGRTVLHLAALSGNTKLVRCLVLAGAELNARDGIHQTALTLSLHRNHVSTAKFLVEIGCNVCEEFYKETASPLEVAKLKKMELLVSIIESRQKYEASVTDFLTTEFAKIFRDQPQPLLHPRNEETENMNDTTSSSTPVNYARNLNINVGDQKNTVTIQGCANRCPDQFGCHTPGAGDFHNRGYVNECLARFAGQGGFWHVVEHVLKRPTVNPQSFRKKFKDNNYNNNEEALADYEDGISIAMLKSFQGSPFFPSQFELDRCYEENKSHNAILLSKFNEWLQSVQSDRVAAYHTNLAHNLLPVRRWYKESIRHGNGKAVEAVWMMCPAIYAQTGKFNYRDESFSHIVNFSCKWPIAYRLMYRQNRTVNVEGSSGRQLAGDEWVEEHLVRPVKTYAKAQTSFSVLEMMSCSSNILEMNKKLYTCKEGFDIHRTKKHRTPPSLYDQLMVAQFALREEWFLEKKRSDVMKYPWGDKKVKEGETVAEKYIDPLEKGEEKAESEFKSFLHRKYPNDVDSGEKPGNPA